MKKVSVIYAGVITALLLFPFAGKAQFNKNPTLFIGDPAPPIKVEAWVKGQPVTAFEKDKIYVVDFWATWCGGCIASFPHLSSIAAKYEKDVHFISVDSYEDVGANKDKEPVLAVSEFLKTSMGQELKVDIAVDGRKNEMFNTWIKKIRRGGFPTTFVIDQEGRIAWIDVNLDHLDWVLSEVTAKKWDRKKAAEIMKQRDALDDIYMSSGRGNAESTIDRSKKILAGVESFEQEFPGRKDAVALYKAAALLELDIDRLPEVISQMADDPLSRYIDLANISAMVSYSKKTFPIQVYRSVAKVEERLLENKHSGTGYGGKTVRSYESIASTYAKLGDKKKAIVSLEEALKIASTQKVSDEQLRKLKEKLRQLQANQL